VLDRFRVTRTHRIERPASAWVEHGASGNFSHCVWNGAKQGTARALTRGKAQTAFDQIVVGPPSSRPRTLSVSCQRALTSESVSRNQSGAEWRQTSNPPRPGKHRSRKNRSNLRSWAWLASRFAQSPDVRQQAAATSKPSCCRTSAQGGADPSSSSTMSRRAACSRHLILKLW